MSIKYTHPLFKKIPSEILIDDINDFCIVIDNLLSYCKVVDLEPKTLGELHKIGENLVKFWKKELSNKKKT